MSLSTSSTCECGPNCECVDCECTSNHENSRLNDELKENNFTDNTDKNKDIEGEFKKDLSSTKELGDDLIQGKTSSVLSDINEEKKNVDEFPMKMNLNNLEKGNFDDIEKSIDQTTDQGLKITSVEREFSGLLKPGTGEPSTLDAHGPLMMSVERIPIQHDSDDASRRPEATGNYGQ